MRTAKPVLRESHHKTKAAQETFDLGRSFSRQLRLGDVVALYGELGAGKTEFVKGICSGLGVQHHIASPSFIIINEYPLQLQGERATVNHIDLYRVLTTPDLLGLGLEEYFSGQGICLVEWADRAKSFLPPHRYDVRFQLGEDESTRTISIEEFDGESA